MQLLAGSGPAATGPWSADELRAAVARYAATSDDAAATGAARFVDWLESGG